MVLARSVVLLASASPPPAAAALVEPINQGSAPMTQQISNAASSHLAGPAGTAVSHHSAQGPPNPDSAPAPPISNAALLAAAAAAQQQITT